MAAAELGLAHHENRQQLAVAAAEVALDAWSNVDRNRIAESWISRLPPIGAIVAAAQLGAARQAEPYVAEASAAQGLAGAVEGLVSAAAFAGVASDGRQLLSLLFQPVIAALTALRDGASVDEAMATGHANLDMIVRTQVADAGRAADQVALTAQPKVEGYTRIVVGKTCNRCIILAGRFYSYSEGFLRHPRCDCVMLPTSQAQTAGLVQDPRVIYESMTKQERTAAGWSAAEQDAIDEGADIVQVTNASTRPGAVYTAGGREFTREGTTRSGLFGGYDIDPETGELTRRSRKAGAKRDRRLTVDQIYAEAKSRDEALRLLRENAYLLGDGTAGGEGRDAETRAVDRQARIDAAKAQAEMLAELEELAVINELDGDALARSAKRAADRFGVTDDPAFATVLRHAEAGNADLVGASIETIAERLGLTRIGGDVQSSQQVIRFDRAKHSMVPGERQPAQGAPVEVVRPGYEFTLDGEHLTVVRAVVDNTDARVAAARPRKVAKGAQALDAVPISMIDLKRLTPNQRSLLGQYRGYAYLNINPPLDREMGNIPKNHFGFAYVREFIDEIDPVMAESRLTSDVEVLRGIADGRKVFGDAWDRNLKGTEWVDHRFQSTSADRKVAAKFVEDDGAMFILRVPKGVGAIQLSDDRYESEILLERGLTKRITADTGPGPKRVIHAEIVPAGPTPLNTLTVPQLKALAKERDIRVPSAARKADIVKLLEQPAADTVLDLSKLKVAELRQLAKDRGVKVLAKDRKADLIAKLNAHGDEPDAGSPPASDADAVAAIAHVNELIDAGVPEDLRGSVAGALDAQVALTPKIAKHLKKVAIPKLGSVWGDHFEFKDKNAFALYVKQHKQMYLSHVWTADAGKPLNAGSFKADVRQSRSSGWFTPSGIDDELGHMCAHEYGHHVAFMFTKVDVADGIYESYLDEKVAKRLLPLMNEALGLVDSKGGKNLLPVVGGKVRGASLKAWIEANRSTLDHRVSVYGSSNFDELLAEIWQEYSTMGSHARPGIRRIGELMRQLAEEAA